MTDLIVKAKLTIANHQSEKDAISMEDFAREIGTSERQLRIIVSELRENNPFGDYFLVSNHESGYWLSNKKEELERWMDGYLAKAYSIFKTAKKARKLLTHKKQMEIKYLFDFTSEEGEEPIIEKSLKGKSVADYSKNISKIIQPNLF